MGRESSRIGFLTACAFAFLFATVTVSYPQQTALTAPQPAPPLRLDIPHSDAPWAPYRPSLVPSPELANSAWLDSLIRDGKLYLSLEDAIALGLENNLDIAIARYNLPIAATDLQRADAGGSTRGVNTGVVQNTPGAGVGGIGTVGGGGAGGTTGGAGTTGSGGTGGTSGPPTLGTQIDRIGRPAINTAISDPFDGDATMHGAKQDAYNVATPATGSTFEAAFEANLAILDSLDTVCGNQFAADKTKTDATRYKALADVLADDQLYIDTSSGTCTTYLGVEANATGIIPNTDCGGRTLSEDVIDESYSLLAIGATTGVGDGVVRALHVGAEGLLGGPMGDHQVASSASPVA